MYFYMNVNIISIITFLLSIEQSMYGTIYTLFSITFKKKTDEQLNN